MADYVYYAYYTFEGPAPKIKELEQLFGYHDKVEFLAETVGMSLAECQKLAKHDYFQCIIPAAPVCGDDEDSSYPNEVDAIYDQKQNTGTLNINWELTSADYYVLIRHLMFKLKGECSISFFETNDIQDFTAVCLYKEKSADKKQHYYLLLNINEDEDDSWSYENDIIDYELCSEDELIDRWCSDTGFERKDQDNKEMMKLIHQDENYDERVVRVKVLSDPLHQKKRNKLAFNINK